MDEKKPDQGTWLETYRDDKLRYYLHKSTKGPIVFFKYYGKFPNSDPKKLFDLATKPENAKYTKGKVKERVLENINDHIMILLVEKKMPTLMSDRENIILRFAIDSEKHSHLINKYGLQGLRRPFYAIYYRSIHYE